MEIGEKNVEQFILEARLAGERRLYLHTGSCIVRSLPCTTQLIVIPELRRQVLGSPE